MGRKSRAQAKRRAAAPARAPSTAKRLRTSVVPAERAEGQARRLTAKLNRPAAPQPSCRPLKLGSRSCRDRDPEALTWTCDGCGKLNRPRRCLVADIPVLECDCGLEADIEFDFSLGGITINDKKPIVNDNVKDQAERDCTVCATVSNIEVSLRMRSILSGEDIDECQPLVDIADMHSKYDQFRNDYEVNLDQKWNEDTIRILAAVAKYWGVLSDEGTESKIHKLPEFLTVKNNFYDIVRVLADGHPLTTAIIEGKKFRHLKPGKIYKAPSEEKLIEGKSRTGHAILLVGAGRRRKTNYYHFVNSWGKHFCVDESGQRYGFGMIRASDIRIQPVKFVRFEEDIEHHRRLASTDLSFGVPAASNKLVESSRGIDLNTYEIMKGELQNVKSILKENSIELERAKNLLSEREVGIRNLDEKLAGCQSELLVRERKLHDVEASLKSEIDRQKNEVKGLVHSRSKRAGQESTQGLGGVVGTRHNSASLNKGSIQNTEVREDSVAIACVVPDAGDTAFQIHCLRRSAYAAVLRAFCAQSDLLSRAKQEYLARLRNELQISDTEYREYIVKASTNKHTESLSAWYMGNIGNAEVAKEYLDLKCVIPDAGDPSFQIHCLERSAYASVLRAFCAQSDFLSWARLLTKLRNELRLSYIEHREIIAKVSSNEYIKSFRKFSLVNYSGLMKKTPAFDLRAVVPDKIEKIGQSFTSLVPQSPMPAHTMSPARNIGILGTAYRTTKGLCFDPDAIVPAKKLKSVSGSALAYSKGPCSEQLPEAVSSVRVESSKHDLLDSSKKLPCAMKAGCAVSPMFREKHNQSNAGHFPCCVHEDMEASRKSGTEASPVSRSKSMSVITYSTGNVDHDSDIIKILLTCGLVNKVEELFKEKPDPAILQTSKLILKDEGHLLDALVELSEVSSACLVYLGYPVEVNQYNVVEGDPVSYDEAPTSSITELWRAETEGETQGAQGRRAQGRRELEPAAKWPWRATVRLSGVKWVKCLSRKRKKRMRKCVLQYHV